MYLVLGGYLHILGAPSVQFVKFHCVGANVPNLPICTCDIMKGLLLRSEYEQTIGLEKLGTNPSIILHTYIIQ